MFKETMGETPAQYVKRLRLEEAAHLLIYEQQLSVTEVAFQSGFTSLSYFTSAFSAYFHRSPRQWREGGYLDHFSRPYQHSKKSKLYSNNKQDDSTQATYTEYSWLDINEVKVVHLSPCMMVTRQSIGPYTEGIPSVWEDVYQWAASRDVLKKSSMILGAPKSNPYITPPEKSRYECCLEVTEAEAPEEILKPFNGGKHVLYTFHQPVSYEDRSYLMECYGELYSFWLPKSGFRYLENPIEFVTFDKGENSSLQVHISAIALAIEPK